MVKTERLYYTDCHLREFEARVLEVEPGPQGFRVYLDRTAFYPESGGQPADRGTLDGVPVIELTEDGEAILHLVGRKPSGETVKGEIDWQRRFDHMQQHSGQHVLSAAFERTGKYKTVSFHLGAETSTIDLDSDRLGPRQLEEAESLANQVVFENREIRIAFRSASEAKSMGLRKPTDREGDVRLVGIENFDLSACGGTHVARTGAVGMIAARKVERMKGLTRVEFVCGGRALRAARSDFQILSEAARLFSASSEQLPALVARQFEELRSANRAREKLAERVAAATARELWAAATEKSGRKIVRQVFDAPDKSEAKQVAHEIAAKPSSTALLGVKGDPASLFFSQSAGGAADMAALLKQTVAEFGGHGGGSRDFAQGGGLDEAMVEGALQFAEELVERI